MLCRLLAFWAVIGLSAGVVHAETVYVNVVGPGTGTVTSEPAGISCPGQCFASFSNGTSVTLTAVPDGGSRFDNWSGACGGPTAQCSMSVEPGTAAIAGFRAEGDPVSVVHHFAAPIIDGHHPFYGHPISDGVWLYGMTAFGGRHDGGMVYRQKTDGSEFAVIHSFSAERFDSSTPWGSLILEDGVLYGMTLRGGVEDVGTVFRIEPDGSGFRLLHSFGSSVDNGSFPDASLTMNGGWLYGMTRQGGVADLGTVFRLSLDGSTFELLHSFTGSVDDGRTPLGSLTVVGDALFGTTGGGGAFGEGTVFRIDGDGTGFALLHSFDPAGPDGTWPRATLVADSGVLYGTTRSDDSGTIFRINTDGSGFDVLHTFSLAGSDGRAPTDRLLIRDGVLYGVTTRGGSDSVGTIFSIATDGTAFTTLHSFSYPEGISPLGSLCIEGETIFGMTTEGGPGRGGTIFAVGLDGQGFRTLREFGPLGVGGSRPHGQLHRIGDELFGITGSGGTQDVGTLFRVLTDGTGFEVLREFSYSGSEGRRPRGSLSSAGGYLYGALEIGASGEGGSIYRIRTDGSDYMALHVFSDPSLQGASPFGPMVHNGDTLYGVTAEGGSADCGTIYQINNDGTGFLGLHAFGAFVADGCEPSGPVILVDDLLFGVTRRGGDWGDGALFSLNSETGEYSLLHSFDDSVGGGSEPMGALVHRDGMLVGATKTGGAADGGTMYEISVGGTGFAVLRSFGVGTTEEHRLGSALHLEGDLLYGLTYADILVGFGTIFRIAVDGSGFEELHILDGPLDGGSVTPYWGAHVAPMPRIDGGRLYVPTLFGGVADRGTILSMIVSDTMFADGFESGDTDSWSGIETVR